MRRLRACSFTHHSEQCSIRATSAGRWNATDDARPRMARRSAEASCNIGSSSLSTAPLLPQSIGPLSCRNICGRAGAELVPGGPKLGALLNALGDGAQEPVFRRGYVGVVRPGQLPRDRRRLARLGVHDRSGFVVDGDAEQGAYPGPGVGAVVGQGLAGPVPGDQDPPAADAEGGLVVHLALAVAR